MEASKNIPYYRIKSVEKAARILDLLAEEELSVSDIGKRIGMHRSATHRFLAHFRNLGFLEQSIDSKYKLSLKLFELGISVINRLEIKEIVHPFLVNLGVRFQETTNLGIRDGLDVIYIDKIESPNLLRTDLALGCRVPAYCTALGKTILSTVKENGGSKDFQQIQV